MARPTSIVAIVAALMAGSANGCSPWYPNGLQIIFVDAAAGSNVTQLKVVDFGSDFQYSYEPDPGPCSRTVLAYDWTTSTLTTGGNIRNDGGPDLGEKTNGAGFNVEFSTGSVLVNDVTYILADLINPDRALFWYFANSLYFLYSVSTSAGASLAICSLAERTCEIQPSPFKVQLLPRDPSREVKGLDVYEQINMVVIPDPTFTCSSELFFYIGQGNFTYIPEMAGYAGMIGVDPIRDVAKAPGSDHRVLIRSRVKDDVVELKRLDLTTGVEEIREVDTQMLRSLLEEPCTPSSPPSPGGAIVKGDPHLTFAHGGKADFRGCDACLFNFLSARDLSVNVKTEAATFMLDGAIVQGSFITEVHIVSFDRGKNIWLNMSYWAKEVGEGNWGWRVLNGTCRGAPFVLNPNKVKECGDVTIKTNYASALISLPQWVLRIDSRNIWDRIDGPHHRLDLAMKPTVREAEMFAWPHGIIGQSFDGDNAPISGKKDDYTGSVVLTEAMAEGAIEGVASEYQVVYPFETDFKYSRFNVTAAASRPRAMARAHMPSDAIGPAVVQASFASSTELGMD